jgi:hypothetical protein
VKRYRNNKIDLPEEAAFKQLACIVLAQYYPDLRSVSVFQGVQQTLYPAAFCKPEKCYGLPQG